MDENLYYKGINKSVVHGARLHQSHSLVESEDNVEVSQSSASASAPEANPPYPFESGKALLALTKKYNVNINNQYNHGNYTDSTPQVNHCADRL